MNIYVSFSQFLIWSFISVSIFSFLISIIFKAKGQFKKYIIVISILFIFYLIQINHPGKLTFSKINWLTLYFLLIILISFIISINEEIKEKRKKIEEKTD